MCASLLATGVAGGDFHLQVIAGAGQLVTAGQTAHALVAQVTDGAGHAIAGAAVSVYQTVTAVGIACPPTGRCPVQPVLLSRVDVLTSDANGTVTVQPLRLDGLAADTHLLFSTGAQAEATAVLSSRP